MQSYTLELEAKVAKFREINPELQKNQTGVGSFFVYPEELHKLLVYFKDTYNEPKINITEKGSLRLIQAVVPLMESRKKGK
ncbi:vicianin hydrolase-like [Henckelia pumila]|uniref:vicianin hydrolase-like n=1 Tax=Henckelia pumila TaxID=405737 RepID=UPI003C6DD0FE